MNFKADDDNYKKFFLKDLSAQVIRKKIRSTLKSLRELIRFFQPMANSAPNTGTGMKIIIMV